MDYIVRDEIKDYAFRSTGPEPELQRELTEKTGYPEYYEEVLARTRPGGIILFDNMFMDGRVLNPEDEASRIIDRLNRTITEDDRVENVFLTIRDGMQLVRKIPR